jgi:trehalose-phosphatase
MKFLFEDWETVQHRIRRAQALFLLLDYDGTLTPIVDRPELALIPPEVKVLLERLRDCPKVLLAIICGRSLEDVRAKVGISGITYVGNHGLEIENPVGVHRKRLSLPREQELKRIMRSLERRLRLVPGILLEDKGPILTVHYRNAPPEYRLQVRKAVEEVLGRWRDRWEAIPGKKILEVRPRIDFGKGRTVQQLLDGMPSAGVLPVYLGDDRSDEDAFRALSGKGISIFVGPRSTPVTAEYSLRGPSEVQEFLERCLGILGS